MFLTSGIEQDAYSIIGTQVLSNKEMQCKTLKGGEIVLEC
jgi:hypothetical protein